LRPPRASTTEEDRGREGDDEGRHERRGGDVHVSITRVNSAGQPIENATLVAQEMHRWLRDIEGFRGFLMLSRPGTTVGLAFWESRAVAEQHRPARMEFIQRMTSAAAVQVEEIVDYDVAFAHLEAMMVDVRE
jgi:hypothetical protein